MKIPRESPLLVDIAGAVSVIALVAGVAAALDGPVLRSWREARAELDAMRESAGQVPALAAERARLEAEIDLLERAAGRAAEGLPGAMETFLVLEDLARVSRECDVTLERVTPGTLTSGARFATIPVDLSLHGGFHSSLRFLSRVEAGEHPVRVQRLALSRGAGPADMNVEAGLAVSCMSPDASGEAAP